MNTILSIGLQCASNGTLCTVRLTVMYFHVAWLFQGIELNSFL